MTDSENLAKEKFLPSVPEGPYRGLILRAEPAYTQNMRKVMKIQVRIPVGDENTVWIYMMKPRVLALCEHLGIKITEDRTWGDVAAKLERQFLMVNITHQISGDELRIDAKELYHV